MDDDEMMLRYLMYDEDLNLELDSDLESTLWPEKWPARPKDPFTHAASRAACAGPMLSADGRALLD